MDAQRARHRRDPHLAARRSRLAAMFRWSGWVSAVGSPPKWRARRRPRFASWCWSARWGSSRRRATSPTRRSFRISIIRRPGSMTRPRSRASMAMYRPTSWRRGISRREMVFRTAWKPYMYSQTLPHLLGGVRAPALVVWGDDDRHVPKSAGEAYAKALRNARLETVPRLRTLCRYGKAGRAGEAGDRLSSTRTEGGACPCT